MITWLGECCQPDGPFLNDHKRVEFTGASACPNNITVIKIRKNECVKKRDHGNRG